MKNFIRLSPFIFYFVGFFLNGNVIASDTALFGFELAKEKNSTVTSEGSTLSCNTPTGLYTSYITETAAMFNWSAVPGAQSYSVQIRLPGGAWSFIPGSPFYNSPATVNNLDPGTTYEWRVRANCNYGETSYWSMPVSFTTDGSTYCEIPWGLNTYNITQTTATWDWSPASGAINYSVQWRFAGGTWNNLGGGPWSGTLLNIGGLQPSTTYEWRVRSNCANGVVSPWSAAESFTTLGESCNTPTGLYTSYITETAAMFNWSPVSGAQSYSVQIRLPGGAWSYISGSPFYNSPATINYLNPCTTYEWRVKANCSYSMESYWSSPVSFTTLCNTCDIPTGLYTSYITETAAMFNWSPVSGAQSYSVQIRLPGGAWSYISGSPFYNSPATINYLNPCTTYEWRVKANCSYNNESYWSSPVSFTTLCNTCDTPTGLYTSYITETAAMFNWSPVSGAQSYSVQIRLPGGAWSYIPGSPFYNSPATVNYLTPGTTYEWRVRANCGNYNYSNWSAPVSFTTNGSVSCHAPTELHTLNITQNTATWDWSPVSGAISYSVQWRYPGGTWYNLPGGPWTGTALNIGGLQPGTTYEWRVRSNCANYTFSPWSHSVSFTTLTSDCSTPTGLHTTNITETSATFNWSPVSGAQSYSVQIRLPWGSWTFVTGSPFNTTSVTVYNLSPGTTYEWRVRANCGYWNYSFWSAPVSFTTSGTSSCEAPVDLQTLNITQTTATWDWSPVSGAISYSIQWRYAGGTWYNLQGGPWSNSMVNVGGLQPGTAYEWRVRSNCANGMVSAWSAGASFTTLGNTCDMPAGLFTTDITETSATFHWSAVPGAQSYSVQIRVPNGSWSFVPGSPFPDTSVIVNNLNPGTDYEWRVRANCGSGNQSNWTAPVSFTTAGSGGITDNDECIEATLLTVNSTCVNTPASNAGATASTPPPMGWCPTNWYKDVWFKFAMPDVSNPTVTIRTTAGTLTDAVMEVYSGDCSNLTFITCEDDNYNGNGSTMPVISVTGAPNSSIWVRVWGYGGTTGTFSICVFDYQSNNYTEVVDPAIPVAGELLEDHAGPESFSKDQVPLYQIAPNPASDVLFVTYSQTEESIVTGLVLLDMSGKIVLSNKYDSGDIILFRDQLDVSNLTAGMYVLQIRTTSGIVSEKLSVVK